MSRASTTRATLRTIALLGGAGVTHFVRPQFYEPLVPRKLPGTPRFWVYASGAVELTAAALLVSRRTRRVGGWLSVVTLIGVYPANIQAALDGGIPGAKPPLDSGVAAWLRLPMQFPMIRDAWRVAHAPRPVSAIESG